MRLVMFLNLWKLILQAFITSKTETFYIKIVLLSACVNIYAVCCMLLKSLIYGFITSKSNAVINIDKRKTFFPSIPCYFSCFYLFS